jgi:pre-mRNA-processing factor 17
MSALAALGSYGGSSSSDDDDEPAAPPPTALLERRVVTAPRVVGASTLALNPARALQPGADGRMVKEMKTNLPASIVKAPVAGPARPFDNAAPGVDRAAPNVHSGGTAERAAVEAWSFDEQFHSFQGHGFAQAARGSGVVGTVPDVVQKPRKRRRPVEQEDIGDEDEHGVWAPEADPEEEGEKISQDRLQEIASALESERAKNKRGYDQNEDFDRRDERKISHLLPARHDRDTVACEARTAFHGEQERDYQGRPWCMPPRGGIRSRVDDGHDCFIPKRCIHRFTGHSKGVQRILPFPGYGHLLLSASLDGSCKIWDVLNDRRCMRTYAGHSEAVKDCSLAPDASQFVSCGFDRFARVWDVETGKVLHTMTAERQMMNCVRFYPKDKNILVAGAGDATSGKIFQWDLREKGEPTLIYNHHLAPCNSITFIDDGKSFISTGDDKKIFVWEYSIPVPTKYISEPHMHSVPIVRKHPTQQFWCGQSMDNSIVTYTAGERVKQQRKRTFKGHLNSGYACGITFSPDGKFIASGDGEGKLFFWDFKSTRTYRKLQAHDAGPCIDCAWHPLEPSWVFTAGWDNLVKLWD